MNTPVTISPTYKQMLEEVGKQLSSRKSSLLKRTLLIVWPYIILFVAGYVFNELYDFNSLSMDKKLQWGGVGFALLLCSIVYSTIVSFIFQIEKQIWIDSYFDQRNLTLDQSWNIAKKLFWPAFKFRIHIAWRYYLVPIGAVVLGLFLLIYVLAFMSTSDSYALVAMYAFPLVIVFLIGLWGYSYYLRIKLRYTWFLFLDHYGSMYSFKTLVEDMKKLNAISKSDTFKKSLIATIGTDSVAGLAQVAIGSVAYGMSHFGDVGKVLGSVTRIYGNEAARQAADLGNIAAHYILYRFARKELYGQEQTVNEEIYKLQ